MGPFLSYFFLPLCMKQNKIEPSVLSVSLNLWVKKYYREHSEPGGGGGTVGPSLAYLLPFSTLLKTLSPELPRTCAFPLHSKS